jgi:L-aspartate oxidase
MIRPEENDSLKALLHSRCSIVEASDMNDLPKLDAIRVDAPRYLLSALPAYAQRHTTAILVVGGGAAGLAAALRASERADVVLLTRGALMVSNSARAQGGIAAALDSDDAPAFHVEDTLIAGAELSDLAAVEALAVEAPTLMRELATLGVPFEREDDEFALGLEGGHGRRRIVHAGDATGWALTSVLAEYARACPRIRILEGYQVVDLLGEPGACAGALALDQRGGWHIFAAGATILATGGAGALYGLTSNHPDALGEGIALAYRAGAEVADMEFIQFHPTVMRTRGGQGFLISEAVRGEGAWLLTPCGERFMPAYDSRAELAPRDIVARGISAAMRSAGADHVLLDLTHLAPDYLEQRFPTICARCRSEGIDPARRPIPVAPAAHYTMGGIRTDLDGATSLSGLFAAGECACTGVHGANRLASNSLLECLVFGRRAATAALAYAVGSRLEISDWRLKIASGEAVISNFQSLISWRSELATQMRDHAGLLRSAEGLKATLWQLSAMPLQLGEPTPDDLTAANAILVAQLMITSALLRQESRGAHFRTDFPVAHDAWRIHLTLANGASPRAVETIALESSIFSLQN